MVHDIQQFLSLVNRSTAITTSHHGNYSFGHLPPTATIPGKLLRHPRNLVIVELFFSSPILFTTGIHFSPILLHNQGYPKVCLIPWTFLMPATPLPGYRRYLSVLCFPRPGT
jgi:hypothetical protein